MITWAVICWQVGLGLGQGRRLTLKDCLGRLILFTKEIFWSRPLWAI